MTIDTTKLSEKELQLYNQLQSDLNTQEQDLISELQSVASESKQKHSDRTDYFDIPITDKKLERVLDLYVINPYKRGLAGEIDLDDWFACIKRFEIAISMMKQLDINEMIQNKQIARIKYTPIGSIAIKAEDI